MANFPFPLAPAPVASSRWLAGVRVIALLCTLPLWVKLLVAFWSAVRGSSRIEWFSFLFLPVPWSLPFFHILSRVGVRRDPQKRGLALAVLIGLGWGCVALLFSVLWAAKLGELRDALLIAAAALALLALGVCAIRTYYLMEQEEDDRRTLVKAFGPFILYSVILFVCAVGLPGLASSRGAAGR